MPEELVPDPVPEAPLGPLATGVEAAIATDLAAEYLARLEDGEAVDLEELLARAPDEGVRRAVRELVAGVATAKRGLPRAPTAGSVFHGRYEIVRQIGEGGMGRVYLAKDRELGRLVALKIMSSLGREERDRQAMLLKESRLLALLQHPNIVAVHDCGLEDELAWLVMDYVDGRSLADLVERMQDEVERSKSGRIATREGALWTRAIGKPETPGTESLIDERDWYRSAARIACAIARTIEAAHGQGVLHRDLKPANVMLKSGGQPVVLDFGLAGIEAQKSGEVTKSLYGSVPYLAPEQVRSGQVGIDPRTDVYQLGLILYEVLTLRRAFGGASMAVVMEKVKHGSFDRPRKVNPGVPRELEAICMRALELAPENRYPTARALREDLERYLTGDSVPDAMRSDRWRAFVRAARGLFRRHPVWSAVAGASVVALAVWLVRQPEERAMFQPFRVESTTKHVDLLQDGSSVRSNDGLGVAVRSSTPLVLYAFTTFETPAGQKLANPTRLVPLAELSRAETARSSGSATGAKFGHPVPACEAEGFLQCPCVVGSTAEANRNEGLLVLAFEHESRDVEEWMERLEQPEGSGLPIDTVLASFPSGINRDRGRGAHLMQFTDEEQASFARYVEGLARASRMQSIFPGLRTCWFECPVVTD